MNANDYKPYWHLTTVAKDGVKRKISCHPWRVPNHTTWTRAHVRSMNTSTRAQHEHKHTCATWTQAHVRNMNTSSRTHHEHKHTYATWTHAHVRNMNTSTSTYHEHKHTCATWTQTHVRNMNTSTSTYHEHKHTYATWIQAYVHSTNTSTRTCTVWRKYFFYLPQLEVHHGLLIYEVHISNWGTCTS